MGFLYKSTRIGLHGKPFTLYKLKTMRDVPGPPSTSANDPRITPIGRILRKFKIDELPQLWNVVRRDMNLVGPRPEVPEVMEVMHKQFPEEYDIIVSVRPGITDLASLWNYNEEERLANEPDPHKAYMEKIWPEKRRLQIEYIKNRSLILDIQILIKTFLRILIR